MTFLIWLLVFFVAAIALALVSAPGWAWAGGLALLFAGGWMLKALPFWIAALAVLTILLAAPALLVADLRRRIVTGPIFKSFRKMLPPMSATEREALEAGTVGWDGELFSGKPDFAKLMAVPKAQLSAEEQQFLDTQVRDICEMSNDWEISHHNYDMPPDLWKKIKDSGVLGMIIPKKYGGLQFSALAHSEIIMTLSTRCSASAVSIMVPNSLGPAELLMHYGTEEQKNYYLPRLAKGQEIPCFALTNPHAGSDAGSIPDRGVVCYGDYKGEKVLGFKLTFDKRYITLAPVATVLGMAFRAEDPDQLLGGETDLGITCALIPRAHPGVKIGRRHFPLNAVFMNGPIQGKDVFIPMEFVIGGKAQVGEGWKMLMNCLSVGRAISLPSSNVGMAKLAVRGVGGYARVRRQFRTAIGKFEGVEEALARMGGNLYMMDSTRRLTAQYVDQGEKPAVLSGIAKYHITERARGVVNDGMDVIGGKGICLGPSNFLGRAYQQIPVGITVEGANILTRSLIIFGQGAIRCHPYVFKEMEAARDTDNARGLVAFDSALTAHIGFTLRNAARAVVHGLTGSRFVGVATDVQGDARRYAQQLSRHAASFAFVADVSMLLLGGDLKRKEKLSARLGDALSLLYLGTATIKRYHDEGSQPDDRALLDWALQDVLYRTEGALSGVLNNYPNRAAAWLMRRIVFPFGRTQRPPSDRLGHDVVKSIIAPSASRDRLTMNTFISRGEHDPMTLIERALQATMDLETIEARLKPAMRSGELIGERPQDWLPRALQAKLISAEEAAKIERALALADQVIRVDDFPMDFGLREHMLRLNDLSLREAA